MRKRLLQITQSPIDKLLSQQNPSLLGTEFLSSKNLLEESPKCAITMALRRLKCRRWKHWEQETTSADYQFSNDPLRFRLSHETSFVRAHTSFWSWIPLFFHIGCFFRQCFRSVSKSDYLTLRNAFIAM